MRKPVILITGAGGEIGYGLVSRFGSAGASIVTLDLHPSILRLPAGVARIHWIDHTSLPIGCWPSSSRSRVSPGRPLSSRAEFTPVAAHHVNVKAPESAGIRPASRRIARTRRGFVYPRRSLRHSRSQTKMGLPRAEDDFSFPTTILRVHRVAL
jgi:NAD(P)-dependent dehydrogenase (short-subunit alcohol dehydrogenase family)